MNTKNLIWTFAFFLIFSLNTFATILYVDLNSASPTPPFSSWATAATNIQDAIDAASDGDEILVTNGVYQTGSFTLYDGTLNRVAINKPVTVQSVNGASATFIMADASMNMRCVYLTNGAALMGFTVTNGGPGDNLSFTDGGGVWCESTDPIIGHCILTGNEGAYFGGGAFRGTLNNCLLTNNSAVYGGGAEASVLNNCIICNNFTHANGGGADSSTLNSCLLTGNNSVEGRAAANGIVNNCTIVGNNQGVSGCYVNNSIVYFNGDDTDPNTDGSIFTFSCTPLLQGGFGNFTNDPGLVDYVAGNFHLQTNSSCINSGNNIYMQTNIDLDGNFRVAGGIVDVGAYESQPLVHYVNPNNPSPAPPFLSWATAAATIQDAVDAASPGEDVLVTNGIYNMGGTNVYGLTNRVAVNKQMSVHSVNGPLATVIVGYQMPGTTNGDAAIRCVYLTNNTWLEGFTLTNGATHLLQCQCNDNAVSRGGGVWSESSNSVLDNCIITSCSADAMGGGACQVTLNNCLLTNNTSAYGGGAEAGVLNNCILCNNFVRPKGSNLLTNNPTDGGGGGAASSTLVNCTLKNNSALDGGGAAFCTLTACALMTNQSGLEGGGAFGGILTGCTLSGNLSGMGGGANNSALTNCTLVTNFAAYAGGGGANSTLSGCLLSGNTALPAFGVPPQIGPGDILGSQQHYGGGAYLSDLDHCTLIENSAQNGGGAYGCVLTNCTLSANSANGGGGALQSVLSCCILSSNSTFDTSQFSGEGGGAAMSKLTNCVLYGNRATTGGGAEFCPMANCTVSQNTATHIGGGVDSCNAQNCIIYGNTNANSPNYSFSTLVNCCTTPLSLGNNFGTVTNDPAFVDPLNGDFHLQNGSPCINSGNNTYIPETNDLDGNARIAGGTVDMGAYEFQSPTSVVSYAFLQRYGFPNDGSADFLDPDGDGANNFQEWRAGTDPSDPASALRMMGVATTNNPSGLTVTWQSVSGVNYFLQRSSDLAAHPAFSTIQSNIIGSATSTSVNDTNAIGHGPFFYRVGVQ